MAIIMPKRVVWVLGAGFSRSLGGPLLPDIISTPRNNRLKIKYSGNNPLCLRFSTVESKYREPSVYEQENSGQRGCPWRNAEEFFELIEVTTSTDLAVSRTAQQILNSQLISPPITDFQDLADSCRLYFAAVCDEFVPDIARIGIMERWDPYLRWTGEITADDTIVSFNYDLVVENSFLAANKEVNSVIPSKGIISNAPNLLKLHGSVNWRPNPPSSVKRTPFADIIADNAVPLIATPGPTKAASIKTVLNDLWAEADTRLREADVIIFVGYRFPESDAEAKRRILNAISHNKSSHLIIRIVLGPDRSALDVARLQGLIQWALHGRQYEKTEVIVEPLFAEDFFAVFNRDGLGAIGVSPA